MKLSRRNFLLGTASLVIADPAYAWIHGNQGFGLRQMQLGLQKVNYFTDNFPFLNWWYAANAPTVFRTAGGGGGQVSGAACWTATGGANYFDPTTGDLVSPLNSEVASFSRLFYQPSQQQAILNGLGWQWGATGCLTADWQGSATATITTLGAGGGVDSGQGTTGPITFHLGNGSDPAPILRLTPTNPADPPHGIRIYPTKYAANINAGQIFNPDWLSVVAPFGRIRFMDWNQTNFSLMSSPAQLATSAYQWWGAGLSLTGTGSAGPLGGMPISVMCALLNQTGADGHYCFPHQATDAYVTAVVNAFKAGTTQRMWYSFSNETWNPGNNGSILGQYNWCQTSGVTIPDTSLSVVITNITPGNPTTINVTSTTGLSNAFCSVWSSDPIYGPLLNYKNISLATVTNSTTLTLPINTTGAGSYTSTTDFLSGNLSRGRRYYGYRLAQILNNISGIYGDRTRWRGILETQTASGTGPTTDAINGINVFLAANPPLTINSLFDEIDVTSYIGDVGGFFNEKQPSTVTQANPGVCTLSAHGYTTGQVKKFFCVSGMTQLQNTFATVTVIDANNFSIGIDTTAFTAWINTTQNFVCDGTPFQIMDQSLTNFTNDPVTYLTKYTYFNQAVAASLTTGTSASVTGIPALITGGSLAGYDAPSTGFWAVQLTIANADGLALGQYEGGPNWVGASRMVGSNGAASAQYDDYFMNWNWSTQCATVMTATYAAFKALGATGPSSKYTECGAIAISNPWPGVRVIPGDISNPSWQAVLAANHG